MRFTRSCVSLLLFIVITEAFTNSKLSIRKTGKVLLSAEIDPNDPYAKVLEAYQKRKAVLVDPTPSISSTPNPPVSPDVVAIPESLPSSTGSIGLESVALPAEVKVPETIDLSGIASPEVTIPETVDLNSVPSSSEVTIPEKVDLNDISSSLDPIMANLKIVSQRAYAAASDISADISEKVSSLSKSTSSSDGFQIPFPSFLEKYVPDIPVPAEGKVLTMFDYLRFQYLQTLNKQGGADPLVNPGQMEQIKIAKQNAEILKQNFENLFRQSLEQGAIAGTAIKAQRPAVESALSSQSVLLANIQENFAWYTVAVVILFSYLNQQNIREEIRVEYQEQLDMYKQLAEEAKSSNSSNTGVLSKTTAVKAIEDAPQSPMVVESKLYALHAENEIMKKEISKLSDSLTSLQNSFEKLLAEKDALENELRGPIPNNGEAIISEEHDIEDVATNDDEEESKRLLQVIKDMDKDLENGKTEKKKKTVKAETKTQQKTQASTNKAKKNSKIDDQIIIVVEEEIKPKTTKTTRKKDAPKKKTNKRSVTVEQPFFAESKQTSAATVTIEETTEGHPWAKLAPSTLSRKTVKDLVGFLDERGIKSTDASGKPLAKKELLSAVQSCF